MNWMDVGIVGAVLVPGLIGFKTGVIRVVFTLGGIGLGVWLAMQYYSTLAAVLTGFIEDVNIANAAGFAVIVIGTIVFAWVASTFVKKILSFILLGWVDNVIGAGVGLLMGASVVTAGLYVLSIIPGQGARIESSSLAPYFADIIPTILGSGVGALLP